MTYNLKTLAPVDIQLTKNINHIDDGTYTEEQLKESKLSIQESLQNINFKTNEYFKDIVDFDIYTTPDIQLKDSLGTYLKEASIKYPFLRYENTEDFIKLSDYNKAAKLLGQKQYTLKDNEYIIIADFDSWIPIRNEALKRKTKINLLGKEYYPKYSECQKGFIYISGNHTNTGIIIVPDQAVNDSIRRENIILANYKVTKKEEKIKLESSLYGENSRSTIKNTTIGTNTKLDIYEASIGIGALVTFIGLYLGIIFLISSAAILALKELSESSDNKERYRMLRKIGTDEKMIRKALFRQIAIFFMFPLLIAIIHSIFGIKFCNYILETFGNEQLLPSIIMTAIFIIIIYGGYFLITYACSKNIIKEKH